MSEGKSVSVARTEEGRATVTLDRPDIHNAFDDGLIAELSGLFGELDGDTGVRVVVLTGNGKSFSAGADLKWMRRMADYSTEENRADAGALAAMIDRLAKLSKPTVARVQGAAFGGGVGLVAACDVAIGSTAALFSLSEVRLGLIPSVISPYVLRAMGERQAGRYMVSGERFGAEEAVRVGLLHEAVAPDDLDGAVDAMVGELLKNGPAAMDECKQLIAAVAGRPIDDSLLAETADRIARVRASDEGKEGVGAFLEKRKPSWIGGN